MSPKTAKIDLPYPLCVSQKLKFRFFPDIFTFRLLLTEGSPSYMQIFSHFYGLVYEIGVFCTGFSVRMIFDTRRWQGPSPTSEVFAEFPPHHLGMTAPVMFFVVRFLIAREAGELGAAALREKRFSLLCNSTTCH